MSYLKKMDYKQFAELLLTMKDGDVIDFACYAPKSQTTDNSDIFEAEDWHFAKLCAIPEYCSRFILLDYAGGEDAFAIPLNNYSNGCDSDDRAIVPDFVERYFKQNDCIETYVYILLKEDEDEAAN